MSEEHRYNFEGSMQDFLDAAYRPPIDPHTGNPRPVGGPPNGPALGATDLLQNAEIGIRQFGPQAFALLLHPNTKFEVQNFWLEGEGGFTFENLENMPNKFKGCILQSAAFVEEGTYLVICEADYKKLIERNPETL